MILVDTSVWIDHLRGYEPELAYALDSDNVVMHTLVIGELVCGYVPNRFQQLAAWNRIPRVKELPNDDVLSQIESRKFMETGIGFVDAHVLCACLDSKGTLLWSRDKKLRKLAQKFGVAYSERT